MIKKWIKREPLSNSANKELEKQPEFIRPLLFYRGVKTQESAEDFLNPDFKKDLLDPFLMLGMELAVGRILLAIKNNERIIIFSDYDADGVCAAVIITEFFKKISFENYHIHIGNRKTDGYGLTFEAVDEFIEQKAGLVVTFDCGINDCDEIAKLNENKIDTIVIDHHLVPDKTPCAFAIVDNKQKEDKYPFKELCGAGMAFKAVDALIKKGNFKITEGWEKWLLDLVAIATVADMVSLSGENRLLTFYGLQVFKKTRRVGLLALTRRINLSLKDITEEDIAFTIAPRINIASRMDHANVSYGLLTTESFEEGDWVSGRLESMNIERRAAVDEILEKALEKFKDENNLPAVLVIGDKNWNPGVLGLACIRLVEKFQRPVFVWGQGEINGPKGSCRGDDSVNLVELMNSVEPGILLNAGGHSFAGGFSLAEDKIEILEGKINDAYKKIPKKESELNNIYIDKELSLDDINWENFNEMDKLKPFGKDNPKPVFLFKGVILSGVKKFGNGKIHLQFDFKNSKNKTIPAIGFFIGANENFNVMAGQTINLVANIEKNTFRGANELRLRIVDIEAVG